MVLKNSIIPSKRNRTVAATVMNVRNMNSVYSRSLTRKRITIITISALKMPMKKKE